MSRTTLAGMILLLALSAKAQKEASGYSWPGMGNPVNIPMFLAGNFGELRTNHFHMGIDIKTQGREGLPIMAVDDGFVSRIKVWAYGYGKAIYIEHPNGYTTVYGHLKDFKGKIAEKALSAHYAQKNNTINIYPAKGEIPVKKGEVIARSGNTGGSGGPHLHFEVRRTNGQFPVNPLLFDLPIKDNIKPEIKGIRLYPANEISSKSPYGFKAKGFSVQGSNGRYTLKPGQKISANGTIGIAVHTIDKLNGVPNKCGVYRIRLFVDSNLIYTQESDVLDFSTQRYVNAHMDYALYSSANMNYHKCFLLPNDQLKFYSDIKNEGYFHVGKDTVHIDIVVEDAYRNSSFLSFDILPKEVEKNTKKRPYFLKKMHYDVANSHVTDNIKISIQSKALYEDLDFEYREQDTLKGALTATHKIQNTGVPLQKKYDLTLRVENVPKGLEDKMLIARVKGKGRYSAVGGQFSNGWIHTRAKQFGAFTVLLDTIAPTIEPINLYAKRSLTKLDRIALKVKDNLSGVEKISAWLNGKWILMEYDYKKNLVFHRFDKHTNAPGEKAFRIKVTDERGNAATYKVALILLP